MHKKPSANAGAHLGRSGGAGEAAGPNVGSQALTSRSRRPSRGDDRPRWHPAQAWQVWVWARLLGPEDAERSLRAGDFGESGIHGGLEGWAEPEGGGQRIFYSMAKRTHGMFGGQCRPHLSRVHRSWRESSEPGGQSRAGARVGSRNIPSLSLLIC